MLETGNASSLYWVQCPLVYAQQTWIHILDFAINCSADDKQNSLQQESSVFLNVLNVPLSKVRI